MESPPAKVRKRVYEACDRCRVKKVGCSGDKPICSLCARLGTDCKWSGRWKTAVSVSDTVNQPPDLSSAYSFVPNPEDSEGETTLESRVIALDDKLTEVLDQVRSLTTSRVVNPSEISSGVSGPNDEHSRPSAKAVRDAANLYMKFCHCQPLPLFDPRQFVVTINSKSTELQLCIIGYASRFDQQYEQNGQQAQTGITALKSAEDLVMTSITSGKVELSTLQSLCLLTLCNFNNGRRQQSGIYLSLAVELAQLARLDLHSQEKNLTSTNDEHNRCLWSLVLLQYLCGSFGPMTVAIDTKSLRFPSFISTNRLASTSRQSNSNAQVSTTDLGVEAYAIQMTEVWYEARKWIHQRGRSDTQPPWSGQSQYHQIMLRQMDLESHLPYKHRFKPSGFSDQQISDLSTNRSYWAPWLYLQIIYHAVVCAINHPLLLSAHIRRFRVNQIPELFLQQTADLISGHTDWIIHLLEVAKDKQFEFSDPFLGQCMAIVATIFLQQSYTEDQEKRLEKRTKFSTCLETLKELGKCWVLVNDLAVNLQKFETKLSRAYENSVAQHSPNLANKMDLTLLWTILDNTQPKKSSSSDTILGPSLRFSSPSTSNSEVLNANPIPEPTRVNSLSRGYTSSTSTPASTMEPNAFADRLSNAATTANQFSSSNFIVDESFSAQNFFALGQDFVGSVDDWFTWTEI